MKGRLRPLFWIEAAMALGAGTVFVLTLLWKNWIEIVFGLDPDHQSGALEWAIVSLSVVVTLSMVAAASREWRRSQQFA